MSWFYELQFKYGNRSASPSKIQPHVKLRFTHSTAKEKLKDQGESDNLLLITIFQVRRL